MVNRIHNWIEEKQTQQNVTNNNSDHIRKPHAKRNIFCLKEHGYENKGIL